VIIGTLKAICQLPTSLGTATPIKVTGGGLLIKDVVLYTQARTLVCLISHRVHNYDPGVNQKEIVFQGNSHQANIDFCGSSIKTSASGCDG
jgi:hypothetical protein